MVRSGACASTFFHSYCEYIKVLDADFDLLVTKVVSAFMCESRTRRVSLDTSSVANGSSTPIARDGDRRLGEAPLEGGGLCELVHALCRQIDGLTHDVRSLRAEDESPRTQLARNSTLVHRCLPEEPGNVRQGEPVSTYCEALQHNASVISANTDCLTASGASETSNEMKTPSSEIIHASGDISSEARASPWASWWSSSFFWSRRGELTASVLT